MGYYLVLAFVAAHFVAMFIWSNLGPDPGHRRGPNSCVGRICRVRCCSPALLILSGIINLFVGSASAKWALLAPILVPMLMLLNISPETATAAYRIGDSATNIITPLMVYFPLILIFCQRWGRKLRHRQPDGRDDSLFHLADDHRCHHHCPPGLGSICRSAREPAWSIRSSEFLGPRSGQATRRTLIALPISGGTSDMGKKTEKLLSILQMQPVVPVLVVDRVCDGHPLGQGAGCRRVESHRNNVAHGSCARCHQGGGGRGRRRGGGRWYDFSMHASTTRP